MANIEKAASSQIFGLPGMDQIEVKSEATTHEKRGHRASGERRSRRVSEEVKAETKEAVPKPTSTHRRHSSPLSDVVRHSAPSEMPAGTEWLNTYETEAARKIQTPQKGQHMEDSYSYQGKEVVREVVDRADVVSILKKGHTDRIAYLEKRIEELKGSADRQTLDRLTEELGLTRVNLEQVTKAQEAGQTWAGSGSYRVLLDRVDRPEKAHQHYLPACVNLRTQQVIEDGVVTSSINRSGAVSDYRNGATNLKEMQELREQLGKMKSLDEMTKGQWAIARNIVPDFPKGGSLAILSNAVDRATNERSWVLENQALQDLTSHFAGIEARGDLAAFVEMDSIISYGRVSMLDGIKDPKVEGGFVLNEKNQMLDMEAVYKVLDGKPLIFDGTGPFIDDRGNVHLPFNLRDTAGSPITKNLEVMYFNISAQGNIRNEGVQQPINEIAYKRLAKRVEKHCASLKAQGKPEDARALQNRLHVLKRELHTGPKDGFDCAEEAAMLLVDTGSLLSINCFSGKDRTGLLAALITNNRLKAAVGKLGLKGDAKKALMARWGRQAMGKDGLACRIVADNTGFKALKLSVGKVRLLVSDRAADYLRGVNKRVNMFGDAMKTFVASAGDTGEGQLWAA